MGQFLSYSIFSWLLMLAMYLAYRLFMARDKQHEFNRGILMLIYIASFSATPVIYGLGRLLDQSPAVWKIDGVGIINAAPAPLSSPGWSTIALWIYILGMSLVFIRSAIVWARLIIIIRSGKRVKRDGYTLVLSSNERLAPFSWLRYIVISCKDYDDDCAAIVTHELKHISSRHWIDLIVAQLVCIINWFNPGAWLMRDELMLVHEYQADMEVIDKGHNPKEYQMLLIKKAVGARFPSFANSLNHSKLKKRITMMYKEKGGAWSRLKALALVPMFALALGVAEMPAVRAAMSAIGNSNVTIDKVSENVPNDKTSTKGFIVKQVSNVSGETRFALEGTGLGNNLTVSGGTFIADGKKYSAKSMRCEMTNGNATIEVGFQLVAEFNGSGILSLTINGEEAYFHLSGLSGNI